MDAYEALATRASALELTDPAPDEETERKLIAAALRAPDHGRLRPWRFLSVRGEARHKLGEVLAASLKRRVENASADLIDRERLKAHRAPLIVIVVARIKEHSKIPAIEQLMSAAAAAENIMIASHALGYGAMWKTGDAAYDDAVKTALGLDSTDQIVGFIYIGTKKGTPASIPPLEVGDFLESWPA